MVFLLPLLSSLSAATLLVLLFFSLAAFLPLPLVLEDICTDQSDSDIHTDLPLAVEALHSLTVNATYGCHGLPTKSYNIHSIDMEQVDDRVFRLRRNLSAWNVDGSSQDRLENVSWIRMWERGTGQRRGRCSYSGCQNKAQVGGHIWIARSGVFIAPICHACNYHENANRMQGANATLEEGSLVIESEHTEEMAIAERRIAVRVCAECGFNIANRPPNHTLCLTCWHRMQQRKCDTCGDDISDRPQNHTLCLACYYGRQQARRSCEVCGADISDRPQNHRVCYPCFRRDY